MKTIIWIDDSITDMTKLIKGLFPTLWKKDCRCIVVFTGNHFLRTGGIAPANDITLRDLAREMRDMFEIFCIEFASQSNKTPNQISRDLNKLSPGDPIYISSTDEKIIADQILAVASEDAYIGLDIRLSLPDESPEKITTSMKIYRELSQTLIMKPNKNFHLFFYTSFFQAKEYMDIWKQTFQSNFNFNVSDNTKIFSRFGLAAPELYGESTLAKFYEFLGV